MGRLISSRGIDTGNSMRAAVVRELGKPPVYDDFPEPEAQTGETIVTMSASAVNPLTLTRAAGAHYSAQTPVPFVVGIDGVGHTPDGRTVYVPYARAPFGTLAERAPVATASLIPIPPGLSDTDAAAVAIPGLSAWSPLRYRAPIRPGESVLVHGATGAGGNLAIQVAKHLGARAVIATGRNPAKLARLSEIGADRVIPLDGPPNTFRDAVRQVAHELSVGVVLDYIFGPTAAVLFAAFGGPGSPRGPTVVRYVQIGAIAGSSAPLESALLRSSGLEILGSGIGSSTAAQQSTAQAEVFAAAVSAKFRLATDVRPIAQVAELWGSTGEERRRVFSVG